MKTPKKHPKWVFQALFGGAGTRGRLRKQRTNSVDLSPEGLQTIERFDGGGMI